MRLRLVLHVVALATVLTFLHLHFFQQRYEDGDDSSPIQLRLWLISGTGACIVWPDYCEFAQVLSRYHTRETWRISSRSMDSALFNGLRATRRATAVWRDDAHTLRVSLASRDESPVLTACNATSRTRYTCSLLQTLAWSTNLAAGPKAKGFHLLPLLAPTAPQASIASSVSRRFSTHYATHIAAYAHPMVYPDNFWSRGNDSLTPQPGDPWPCVSLAVLLSRSSSTARALFDSITVEALAALGDPLEGSGTVAAWEKRVRSSVEGGWSELDEFAAACADPTASGPLLTEALVLCGVRDVLGASRSQIRSCLVGHYLLSRALRTPLLTQPAARHVVIRGDPAPPKSGKPVPSVHAEPLACCQWPGVKVVAPGASPPAVRLVRLLPLHVVAPLVSPSFFPSLHARIAEWRRTDISLAQALVTGGSVNHGTSCSDVILRTAFNSIFQSRRVSAHDPPAILLADILVALRDVPSPAFLEGASLAAQALRHVSRRAVAAHAASWDAGVGAVLPAVLRHAVLGGSGGEWIPTEYAKAAHVWYGERDFEEHSGAQEAIRMATRQSMTCSAGRGSAQCLKVSMMVPPIDWSGLGSDPSNASVVLPKAPARGGVLGDYFARPLGSTDERDGAAVAYERVIAAASRVGLQYWLTGGSLLGAMRHGSPIPWASHELHLGVTRAGYDLITHLHRTRLWAPLFGLDACATLDHGHRRCCDTTVPHVCVYFFLHVVATGEGGEPSMMVGIPGMPASTATFPVSALFPLTPRTFLVYLDEFGPRPPRTRDADAQTTSSLEDVAMPGPAQPEVVLDALGVGSTRSQTLCAGRLSRGVRTFSGTGFPCAAYPTTPRHPSHRAAYWSEGFGLDDRCAPTLACSKLTPYHHAVTSIAANELVDRLFVQRLATYIADWTGLEGGVGEEQVDAPLLEAALRAGSVELRRVERCGRRLVDVLHARFEDPGNASRTCSVAAHTYQTLASPWHTVYIGAAQCSPGLGRGTADPALDSVKLPRTPPRCVARAIAAEAQETGDASDDPHAAVHPLQPLYDPMGVRLPKFSVQRRVYDLLRIFNAVMNEAGIMWWADSGTLLGAVRHGGLIPHDDDADIILLLSSFDRFLALQSEFESHGANITRLYFGARVCLMDGYVSWQNPPFLDIFVQDWQPSPTLGNCTAMTNSGMGTKAAVMWPQNKEAFCVDNLLPLKQYRFGGTSVWGPRDPVPYLDRKFGCTWRDRSIVNFPHAHNCGVARLHTVGLSRGHFPVTAALRVGVPDPGGGVDEVKPASFEPRACVSSNSNEMQASMAALLPFDLDHPLLYWTAAAPADGDVVVKRLGRGCPTVGVALGIGTDSEALPATPVEPKPLRAHSGPGVLEVAAAPAEQAPSLWLDHEQPWKQVASLSELNATGWVIAPVPVHASDNEYLVARIRFTGSWQEPVAVRHFMCVG